MTSTRTAYHPSNASWNFGFYTYNVVSLSQPRPVWTCRLTKLFFMYRRHCERQCAPASTVKLKVTCENTVSARLVGDAAGRFRVFPLRVCGGCSGLFGKRTDAHMHTRARHGPLGWPRISTQLLNIWREIRHRKSLTLGLWPRSLKSTVPALVDLVIAHSRSLARPIT